MGRAIKDNADSILHYNMCVVGGFLGTYAILSYYNFGSAQTGNLLSMVIDIYEQDGLDLLLRAIVAVIFALSLIATYLLAHYTAVDLRKLCLLIDATGLIVTVLLPNSIHPLVGLYPIFFAAGFQWGAFTGPQGHNCSSTFLTNNFKQCVLGWTRFMLDHDQRIRKEALLYTYVIASYLAGAYLGCIAVNRWGIRGGLLGLLPLLSARLLIRWSASADEARGRK